MADWLRTHFGPTLTRRFFGPFHERYTAGLWTAVAPQDDYKSPVDAVLAERGARGEPVSAGYNVRFRYPAAGLDALARGLAAATTVHYGRRCTRVDVARKEIAFEDGSTRQYEPLISTLPLNHMMALAHLPLDEPADPYTSVLVLNIGAKKGTRPDEYHWLYVCDSAAGFFRVGSYSAVDPSFVAHAFGARDDRVSLYVERAYPGGEKPSPASIAAYADAVVCELQDYGLIGDTDVVDDTWIDVAYTWSRPGSRWRMRALQLLQEHDIMMVGRYGRWTFQGIADSIRDGFAVGTAMRQRGHP
jgi:protoporphyrinogen oxidase